jgi:SAM-dependent methyltransferase
MSVKKLARRLPSPIYRTLRRISHRIFKPQRTQMAIPNPGPLLTGVAPRIGAIPGWFNIDDLAHFSLVLSTQTTSGIRGDLLEIGCYHGRSAAVLAMHLQADERLFLADAFDLPLDDPYGDTPTPEQVWQNLANAVPNLSRERISIQRVYSNDIQLPPDARVRFAHIDGGHDAATVREDLALCARYLMPGGVVAVDDYAHPQYPGVTEAVDEFLDCQASFHVLADLNRSGALGRKLYLASKREAA